VVSEFFHADGRTDGHEEANNRFSQFCERAHKLVNKNYFIRDSFCPFARVYSLFTAVQKEEEQNNFTEKTYTVYTH
jgi:hypothetical protein